MIIFLAIFAYLLVSLTASIFVEMNSDLQSTNDIDLVILSFIGLFWPICLPFYILMKLTKIVSVFIKEQVENEEKSPKESY